VRNFSLIVLAVDYCTDQACHTVPEVDLRLWMKREIGNTAERNHQNQPILFVIAFSAWVSARSVAGLSVNGLEKPQGVVITRLDPKGAFAKAGLEISDVILAIADEPIDGGEIFVRLVSALPAGQEIPFTILDHRNGEIGIIGLTVK
jgi:hypothetical protein